MNTPDDRLRRLKHLLGREGCTHFLISNTVDVEYLSGFHATRAYLLISRERHVLFTDFRYRLTARQFCAKTPPWEFQPIESNAVAGIRPWLPPGSVVGIQSHFVTVDEYLRMRRAWRRVRFVKIGNMPDQVCIPKLPGEIVFMRKAARIGDAAWKRLTGALRAGMTEIEGARLLDRFCLELGSEKPSFDTIMLFGERTGMPHGIPSRRRLRPGDWVLVDFGCVVNGFCSDMTRTSMLGKAGRRHKDLYNVVAGAQKAARKAVRAGMQCRSLDRIARDIITAAGYGDKFGHGTGHGVGRRIHEKPLIAAADTTRLVEKSVITIEPGIYTEKSGGVRIEDMVVVTRHGGELLTHAPRQLLEINP